MGKQKGEGGKSKARPSSSSLAASLLPSGAAAIGFGGYVGSSRLDSALASDDVSLDIDSEVSQHLKRLARKDPTTKLKALASLSVLFKKKTGKDILPIIPQWAFEYKRLLFDYNREVRRATHDTMTNLVTTVGRELAPHLKSLMGPWWFSQFDPDCEISQAARRSLQVAFPAQGKRLDALLLCTTDIFMYLEENLKLTPQSMSDKTTSLDELEEMHQQVISSSLLALAALVDILVCTQPERSGCENTTSEPKNASKARATAISFTEKLFSNHNYFLDFLKSQRASIRSATYSVLTSFIKNMPNAFNEGNMKILAGAILGAFQEKDPTCHSSMWNALLMFSKKIPGCWTSVNVQKTVLNRFWQFLRSGCYGSQQVSYPALVLFLDAVPSKAIVGEKFFLDFFQNLWAGRNPSHSSNADRLAFFQAFKECFLWGLYNASRYCDGVDTIHHFQVTLVDNILVNLLWHDYVLFVSSKDQNIVLSGNSNNSSLDEKSVESLHTKYPISYVQELGKCIIEILSGIYPLGHGPLSAFCEAFQENCMEIFQQTENTVKSTNSMELVIMFLSLVEQHAVQKGEAWPLVHLVGPMLAKSFPLIKSLDSPDVVRVLSVAVSIFGAHIIIQELVVPEEGHSLSHTDERDRKLDQEHFIHVFKEMFVPWCLEGNNCSTSARIDLLLALLDNVSFTEQWGAIITYATKRECSKSGSESVDSNNIAILAMLIEKAAGEMKKRKEADSNHLQGSCPDHWHHELLDSAAISVACSLPPYRTSDAQFVRAVLGGSTEDSQASFLSRNAMILIFKEVFKKLLSFMMESSFNWVRAAGSLLTSGANYPVPKSKDVLEMARFGLEILDGSFFCLKTMDEESELVTGVSAALFILHWECSMLKVIDDAPNDESAKVESVKARLDFGESVHAFYCKISNQFWKSLNITSRKRLGSTLIQTIRSAIFKEDKLNTDALVSLCCLSMLEVLECLPQDQYEEQDLLNQFLSKGDSWPLWVMADLSCGKGLTTEHVSPDIYTFGHHKFIAVAEKVISKIGIDRVVAGYITPALSSPSEAADELAISRSPFTRPWLAAEILCTWKWQGGSAFGSFLPFLSAFAKSGDHCLLDSIFNILLDGALVHGASGESGFFSVWPTSSDEVESIQEPYLRALVALLFTLFKDNIWKQDKAQTLFELIVNNLSIGETINMNCLRILPLIVSVLIRPLHHKGTGYNGDAQADTSKENLMHDAITDWLQRALVFPPLTTWQTGQDAVEEWLHLVLSCYPLSAIGGVEALKPERDIRCEERTLLLALFRKQRHGVSTSSGANQLPMAQMLLSKLVVVSVGYIWEEFNEEDWDFILSHLRRCIELSVVLMEEVTENVNDVITNSSSDNLEVTLKRLEQAVLVSDPFPISIATNALYAFSMFCGAVGLQVAEDADTLNPLRSDRWDSIKDRILERILRLFFATGVTEAIVSSCCNEASSFIASTRHEHPHFWELVAKSVVSSSAHARDKALKSVEFWGLTKGPIHSLYAILFSSKPVASMQFASFVILSAEPVSQLAIIREDTACLDNDATGNHDSSNLDLSTEGIFRLREEISGMIEKLPYEVLETDSVSQQQVDLFLVWSLLLTHLSSLPPSSSSRERLVQYIQDFADPTILDCLFQHIPLELSMLKKKDVELPAEVSVAATSATRAIKTCSLLFSVESLWPVEPIKISSLVGAIFGLMIRVLPAYVRGWFGDLRDRAASSEIESFTRTWCSPSLIADELSQIKKANISDENFSVSVSKSVNEIVATYTKEETGMDLNIRFPSSYPLRPVDVYCTRSLGITEVKQRKWLLSMTSFVRNQNGALAEAIRIWKKNFDKEFEGVEECPICYSVIHTANHSLPRLACRTCKHKFHSACLYKWFSTSQKSKCPLCQSNFS